jgi:hypothetical protein
MHKGVAEDMPGSGASIYMGRVGANHCPVLKNVTLNAELETMWAARMVTSFVSVCPELCLSARVPYIVFVFVMF